MVYKSSLCGRDLGGNFKINNVFMPHKKHQCVLFSLKVL